VIVVARARTGGAAIIPGMQPLPEDTFRPRLSGSTVMCDTIAGPLAVHVAGHGPPLLLIHSVNAAASAAELRPLHEHYAASHTVFSPDLPGFGASPRIRRLYTPRLMTDALHGVVEHIGRQMGPAPIDALALSLSCEFLARAASETPTPFKTLALISPTGLSGRLQRRAPEGSTATMPRLHRVLQWIGPGLFKGLTRPSVIRFFLQKTWGGPQIDALMFEEAVRTAHASGAEHAPLSFLCGALFSRDILNVYESLQLPVWMCHGVRGDFTDYRQKALLESRSNWTVRVFPTGALPHFERPADVLAALDAHWAGA